MDKIKKRGGCRFNFNSIANISIFGSRIRNSRGRHMSSISRHFSEGLLKILTNGLVFVLLLHQSVLQSINLSVMNHNLEFLELLSSPSPESKS